MSTTALSTTLDRVDTVVAAALGRDAARLAPPGSQAVGARPPRWGPGSTTTSLDGHPCASTEPRLQAWRDSGAAPVPAKRSSSWLSHAWGGPRSCGRRMDTRRHAGGARRGCPASARATCGAPTAPCAPAGCWAASPAGGPRASSASTARCRGSAWGRRHAKACRAAAPWRHTRCWCQTPSAARRCLSAASRWHARRPHELGTRRGPSARIALPRRPGRGSWWGGMGHAGRLRPLVWRGRPRARARCGPAGLPRRPGGPVGSPESPPTRGQ